MRCPLGAQRTSARFLALVRSSTRLIQLQASHFNSHAANSGAAVLEPELSLQLIALFRLTSVSVLGDYSTEDAAMRAI